MKKCCGLTKESYYEYYYPRYDLYTGERVSFKNLDQYFGTQFLTKENAIQWYRDRVGKVGGTEEAIQVLSDYFLCKKFSKMPTQSELRCKKVPSIIGIEALGVDYYKFCERLNLSPRFVERNAPTPKKVSIVTDTREQLPVFTNSIEKLEVGDYTTFENFEGVFVERKSLADFIGTFSRKENYDRFERELERAADLGYFLIVVCEQDFETVFSWKNPFGGRSCGYSALVKMCEFMQKFDCCQFVFLPKRLSAKDAIVKFLEMGASVSNIDLQLLIDLKKL